MPNWQNVNNKYIREGELYLSFDFLDTWNKELKHLNKGKEGARYLYPTSLFRFSSTLKVVFHIAYRQQQGFFQALQKWIPLKNTPYYTQIQRRVNKLGLNIVDSLAKTKEGQIIAVDSTGIKLYNSGEWIREKHKKHKPFLKLHIAVNVKTKQAVGIEITEDNIGDTKVALPLIEQAQRIGRVKKGLFDGAYDKKEIWDALDKQNIEPVIRLRKNARPNGLGVRPRAVRLIKKIGKKRWIKKKGYGQRWQAESWYSSYKRRFGEHCFSRKPENVLHEILLKACICNRLII